MYERHIGPIPEGLQLDHLCRNRACINPAHLEPVTNLENLRRGELPKLTVEKVREIRALMAGGRTMCSVAKEYGVVEGNVAHIVHRRTWKDV
jgi:hypothetical protein